MITIRQKRFLKLVGKSRTEGEAMIKAGYAPNTAIKPSQVKKSKGWKQLLDQYLPDEKLLGVHDELLDSKQDQIRLGAVGLGYKVKGKLAPETVNTANFNVGEMSVQFREKE